MATHSMKVTPSNIHYLRRLFDALREDGGLGISFQDARDFVPGHKYLVKGFDRDSDICVTANEKDRTVNRSTLMNATVHAAADMEPIISDLSKASDILAKSIIDRYHVERVFAPGDRVRFISILAPNDSPNEALYVVETSGPELQRKNFDEPFRDIILGYFNAHGKFMMFSTCSRLLEIDR
jgi:hypothetical protein